MLHERGAKDGPDRFEFLTASMLTRLADLQEAADDNGVAYVLATNFVGRLDDAAIRAGRFEEKVGVYDPDPASRLCRLIEQFEIYANGLLSSYATPTEASESAIAMGERPTVAETMARRPEWRRWRPDSGLQRF